MGNVKGRRIDGRGREEEFCGGDYGCLQVISKNGKVSPKGFPLKRE